MNSRITVVDTRRLLPPRVLWATWLRSFKTVAKKPQVISCGVVFAADGRLAAGGANEVRIWKSVTARTPRVERRVPGNCLALAFDLKGRLLVLIHTHQMRHEVWVIGRGQGRRAPRRLLTIAGPDAEIMPVAFSPGARYLATVEQSTAVLLWRIPD